MEDPNNDDCKISSKLNIKLINDIFKEAINKIDILEKIKGWPIIKANLEIPGTIEECWNEKHDYTKKTDQMINIEWFQENCDFFKQIFTKTLKSLNSDGSFQILKEIHDYYKKIKENDNQFIKEAEETKIEYDKLSKALDIQRAEYFDEIQECTENIGKIKDEIADLKKQSDAKLQFVMEWKDAKCEMNNIKYNMKEEKLADQIRWTTLKIDQEERIHTECTTFLKELVNDLNNSVEEWREKYDETLLKYTDDVKNITEEIRQLEERKTALLAVYKQRANEMQAYQEHKEYLARERAALDEKIRASTIIQAWWRGVMVRKGFGPYRKKRDKKAKKKDANKKENEHKKEKPSGKK